MINLLKACKYNDEEETIHCSEELEEKDWVD